MFLATIVTSSIGLTVLAEQILHGNTLLSTNKKERQALPVSTRFLDVWASSMAIHTVFGVICTWWYLPSSTYGDLVIE